MQHRRQVGRVRRARRIGVPLALIFLTLSLNIGQAHADGGIDGWTQPDAMLPRADTPVLAVNPVDHSISYVAASGAFGIVTGNELHTWKNGTYLKLGDGGEQPSAAYDSDGTLLTVWAQRRNNDVNQPFNIMFTATQRWDGNNGSRVRNLTHELWGDYRYTLHPALAYVPQTHTLFLAIEILGDPNQDPFVAYHAVVVTHSSDSGASWSTPEKVGEMSGYIPATPVMVADTNGVAHLFYGQQTSNEGRAFIFHRAYRNGGWSAAQEITGGNRTRALFASATAAANGDVWVSWLSDPQSGISPDKEVAAAHWNSASDIWTHWNNLSRGQGTSAPTIAAAPTGTIWLMWGATAPTFRRGAFTTTSDNGANWRQPQTLFDGRDLNIANVGTSSIYTGNSIAAIANAGAVYLVFGALQTNPVYIQDRTLYVTQIGQSSINPPTPTPNPSVTPFPVPTDTPGPTVPGETPTAPATATVSTTPIGGTPIATGTPTATATPVPMACAGDEYEPDDSTQQALDRNRFIVAGSTEQHSLCNRDDIHVPDVDTVLVAAQAGQSYTLLVTAQHFFPEMSVGQVGQSPIGKWADCAGDTSRLCVSFTATVTASYYARISDAQNAEGNPGHTYSLSLFVGPPPPTAAPAPTRTVAPPIPTPTISPANTFAPQPQPNAPGGRNSGNTVAVPATATRLPTAVPHTAVPGSSPAPTPSAAPFNIWAPQAFGGTPQIVADTATPGTPQIDGGPTIPPVTPFADEPTITAAVEGTFPANVSPQAGPTPTPARTSAPVPAGGSGGSPLAPVAGVLIVVSLVFGLHGILNGVAWFTR